MSVDSAGVGEEWNGWYIRVEPRGDIFVLSLEWDWEKHETARSITAATVEEGLATLEKIHPTEQCWESVARFRRQYTPKQGEGEGAEIPQEPHSCD